MSVIDLKPGEKGCIDTLKTDDKLTKRLYALGCIEGTEICLKGTAPFGDPVLINIRGFNLALRKGDAKNIYIK